MPNEGTRTDDTLSPVIVRAPHPSMELPWGHGTALRDHRNPLHMIEDLRLLEAGILDKASFVSGYMPHKDPVRIEVRSKNGELKAVRHSHNLRPNNGTKWQSLLMGGDVAANLGYASTGNQVYTATGVTPAVSPAWTVNQWIGHLVTAATGVYGVITANSATALSVDQWYLPGSATAAAGATPTANTEFVILPGQGPAGFIALTNDATQSIDTAQTALTAEITTNGLARAFATFAHTPPSTTAGTTNQGTYTLAHTFTATGAQSCQRAAIFNALTGGIMAFFASFTGATLASADTIAVTWTIND